MAFFVHITYICFMEQISYSFIIPVYNRPNEIKELLESFVNLIGDISFEVVIVEDGSIETSKDIVDDFSSKLNITYFFKENSGPGDSRNYGMSRAKGNYFIILDSDVILPEGYIQHIDTFLKTSFRHCIGGPDAADKSFNNLQKAINFAMTSFLTTGGIRGGSETVDNFQPRSFNMGLSKEAFIESKGFGKIHPGEDPDLVLRLISLGYKTALVKKAFVYHKRRISWSKFYTQVYKFGTVRPILNQWHPKSARLVYWFPTLFSLGLLFSMVLIFLGVYLPIYLFILYFSLALIISSVSNRSLVIGLQSIFAICTQFFGYGFGFLFSTFKLNISKQPVEVMFPKLFFK